MDYLTERNQKQCLANLKTGEQGIITKIKGEGAFRNRISEMGFIKGKHIKVIKNAPLKDPVEYEVMGYKVLLRRSDAKKIEIVKSEAIDKACINEEYNGVLDSISHITQNKTNQNDISLALVGNPNCGKTSLFNYASGAKEKVGNYAGVTVDIKEAKYKYNGFNLNLADLPGTYSITDYSPEELFVRQYILNNKPDIVINVIDASNLERNLYLTTQLIDMGVKVVIALNMHDELTKSGAYLNIKKLGKLLGIPIVPTVASKGEGLENLFQTVIETHKGIHSYSRSIAINYGKHIEKSIESIQNTLKKFPLNEFDKISNRYLAIKLLEQDKNYIDILKNSPGFERTITILTQEINYIKEEYKENPSITIADQKYGFIAGALKETYIPAKESKKNLTKSIDNIVTNKIFGFPIFILFMWITFQATFTLGGYPMELIDFLISKLSYIVDSSMQEGPLKSLITDGIIGGVGGVIIFMPNILILFFFISLMEDTGYMSRAAFIMDKLMHKIGLHGKSFIPLVMGFGCNVPAVMATRTLDNKNDRLLTMLILPFMSCSARLPVYVLLISAFFPSNQGTVLFSIYIIGIILAIIVGMALKKTLFTKKEVPFVMELPPYRIPTLKNTTIHMWHKGAQYLKKMGGVILVSSIIIWTLSNFPKNTQYSKDYEYEISSIAGNKNISTAQKQKFIQAIELEKESERQQNSYIGKMGKFIEPIIKPLGFDWKIGVSIITGLGAKEIVVSSMGVLYNADIEADETSGSLISRLKDQKYSNGAKKGKYVFSPLVAYSLMIFILIYFPCIAVIAAIKKESNWKWATFTMVYTTIVAWISSFLVYQIGSSFI